MRYIPRALLAGGLGFAVAVLVAACGGSSGLLSADQASTLDGKLSAVVSAIDANRCTKAGTAAQSFDNAVSSLPSSVNHALTDNLKQASAALAGRAEQDCESAQTASIPTTTKTTPTTPTDTNTSTTNTNTTTNTSTTSTGTGTSTGSGTSTSPATSGTGTGSNTTTGQSGGAGLGGSTGTTTTGSGGASATGNAQ